MMHYECEEEFFDEDLHFYDGLSVVEEESDSDLFREIECGDTDNIPDVTSLSSSSSFSSSSSSFFSSSEEEDYSSEVMTPNLKEKRRYTKKKTPIQDTSRRGSGFQDTDINYTSDERNFTERSLRSYDESEPSFDGDRVDLELFGIENGLSDIR